MKHERAILWDVARELAAGGAAGALATVARHRGSLPMARDAKMLVTADGRRWGTIGGGCMEADVTRQALQSAADGRPARVRHTLNTDVAGDLGLACGGTVELFLEPLIHTPEAVSLYGAVAQAVEQRESGTVMTALDWSAGAAKAAVFGNRSFHTVKSRTPLTAYRSPRTAPRAPRPAYIDDDIGALVEPVVRVPRVIIFGAGHVGAEIAKVAAGAGFYVVVSDDREEFAHRDRLSWADEVLAADFRAVLDGLTLDEDDYVVVSTRGHGFDANIVERVAGTAAGYVGMLGSRRKWAVIRRLLERQGVPAAALDRVRAPIGEDIGADTPAEIAVSVVAQLIRCRRENANPEV